MRTISVSMLREYAEKLCKQHINQDAFRKILSRHSIGKIIESHPMESERMQVRCAEIDEHFKSLKDELDDVPACCVLNIDETGIQPWVDASVVNAWVPIECDKTSISYPVVRSGKRATVLVAISLDGERIRPLVVVQRKTIDSELISSGYFERTDFAAAESGFVNRNIFISWLRETLGEYSDVARARAKKLVDYDGPLHIILDGCSSHKGGAIESVCKEKHIKMHYLPSHSSHLLQPLDLNPFGVMKSKFNGFHVEGKKFSEQSACVYRSLVALDAATAPHIVVSAFRAAGINTRTKVSSTGWPTAVVEVQTSLAKKAGEYLDERRKLEEAMAQASSNPAVHSTDELVILDTYESNDCLPFSEAFADANETRPMRRDRLVFGSGAPPQQLSILEVGTGADNSRRITLPESSVAGQMRSNVNDTAEKETAEAPPARGHRENEAAGTGKRKSARKNMKRPATDAVCDPQEPPKKRKKKDVHATGKKAAQREKR